MADKVSRQAQQVIKKAAIEGLVPFDENPGPDVTELDDSQLIDAVRRLHNDYRRALDDLARERGRVDKDGADLGAARASHARAVEALKAEQVQVTAALEDLARRELDADSGFAARERAFWQELQERMHQLRADLRESVLEVEEADVVGVRERVAGFQQLRADLESSFAERSRQVEAALNDLEARTQELRRDRRRLTVEQQQLEWDREKFDSETATSLARERALHEEERRTWQEQKAVLEQIADELRTRAARAAEIERQAKFVDPVRLEAERTDLISRLQAAHEELARRPDANEIEEMRAATRVLEARSGALEGAIERAGRLESQLETTRAAFEALRLVDSKNQNLTAEKAALDADVAELRRALGDLSERRRELRPFQQCSAMDEDNELQATPELWSPDDGLELFVSYLRNCIAASGLFYDAATIRSFLAGMRMSRLLVLQGISGTGKSSLPQAVASAMGVDCAIIEVQAAWRDRQDLLGYFNPFEHRFEESDFLAAVYRSGLPRHASAPFFILLDEMNLAHPEQYLADVLSVLPRPEGDRFLRLMNRPSAQTPALLRDGMSLELRPNVWIVGTANHDQTTVALAPKTYDRAHVMELPLRHPPAFEGAPPTSRSPVSMAALNGLFAVAADEDRHGATRHALGFLDSVRPSFARIGIGWGNRVEQQMREYAPIVTGAGGSVREAVDDFVASKLLKKLEGGLVRRERLEPLKVDIGTLWSELPGESSPPGRMFEILDREIEGAG